MVFQKEVMFCSHKTGKKFISPTWSPSRKRTTHTSLCASWSWRSPTASSCSCSSPGSSTPARRQWPSSHSVETRGPTRTSGTRVRHPLLAWLQYPWAQAARRTLLQAVVHKGAAVGGQGSVRPLAQTPGEHSEFTACLQAMAGTVALVLLTWGRHRSEPLAALTHSSTGVLS